MDKQIDLNCDMGESFGRYTIGADADMMHILHRQISPVADMLVIRKSWSRPFV